VLASVVEDGFRVARPVAASDGRWVVDGWIASRFVDGVEAVDGRWDRLIKAARAFHAALADLPRPDHLDRRDDRWSIADRVIWGEATIGLVPAAAELAARITPVLEPVELPSQVVHGDLGGNVWFGAGRPLVLDFSPYWRPTAWAEATAIVDGLMFGGAPASALDLLDQEHALQMALRGLLFRVVTGSQRQGLFGEESEWPRAAAALDVILGRL
jgi:uncharacterized protein (TIGR02569 family)